MPKKIILKEGGLNGAVAPSGFKFLGLDGNDLSLKTGVTVSRVGGDESLLYKEIDIPFTKENLERIWDGYELVEGQEGKLIDLERIQIISNVTAGPFPGSISSFGGGAPQMDIILAKTTNEGHIKTLSYTSPTGLSSGMLDTFEQEYYDDDIDDFVVVATYTNIPTITVVSDSEEKESLEGDGMWIRIVDGQIIDYFLMNRYVGFEVGDTITIPNGTIDGQASDIVFTVSELTDSFLNSFNSVGSRRRQVTRVIPSQSIVSNNIISIHNTFGVITSDSELFFSGPVFNNVGDSLYFVQTYNGIETDLGSPVVTWRYFLKENGIDVMEGNLNIKLWYRILE